MSIKLSFIKETDLKNLLKFKLKLKSTSVPQQSNRRMNLKKKLNSVMIRRKIKLITKKLSVNYNHIYTQAKRKEKTTEI